MKLSMIGTELEQGDLWRGAVEVQKVYPPDKGRIDCLVIDDSISKPMKMKLWGDYDSGEPMYEDHRYLLGKVLKIKGRVDEYRGRYSLAVRNREDISLDTDTDLPERPAPPRAQGAPLPESLPLTGSEVLKGMAAAATILSELLKCTPQETHPFVNTAMIQAFRGDTPQWIREWVEVWKSSQGQEEYRRQATPERTEREEEDDIPF